MAVRTAAVAAGDVHDPVDAVEVVRIERSRNHDLVERRHGIVEDFRQLGISPEMLHAKGVRRGDPQDHVVHAAWHAGAQQLPGLRERDRRAEVSSKRPTLASARSTR